MGYYYKSDSGDFINLENPNIRIHLPANYDKDSATTWVQYFFGNKETGQFFNQANIPYLVDANADKNGMDAFLKHFTKKVALPYYHDTNCNFYISKDADPTQYDFYFPAYRAEINTVEKDLNYFPFIPAKINDKYLYSVGATRATDHDKIIAFRYNSSNQYIECAWVSYNTFKTKNKDTVLPPEQGGFTVNEFATWIYQHKSSLSWKKLAQSTVLYFALQGAGGGGSSGYSINIGAVAKAQGTWGGGSGAFTCGAIQFTPEYQDKLFILEAGDYGKAYDIGYHSAWLTHGGDNGASSNLYRVDLNADNTGFLTRLVGVEGGKADTFSYNNHRYGQLIISDSTNLTLFNSWSGTVGGDGSAETGYAIGIPWGHKYAEAGDNAAVIYETRRNKKDYSDLHHSWLLEDDGNPITITFINSAGETVHLGQGGSSKELGGNSYHYAGDGGGGAASMCSGAIDDSNGRLGGYGGGGAGASAEPAAAHGAYDGLPGMVAIIAFRE